MNWWGKILGGVLGYLLADIIGALIGVVLGHQFDRNARLNKNQNGIFNRGNRESTQKSFFNTTFSILGHISKSDRHVSPEEIQLAEQVMQQMRLSKEQRIAAIELFNQGKQTDFDLNATLMKFREECKGKAALIHMFIEIQLRAVYADGNKSPHENQILQQICRTLGYPEVLLAQLESMLFASRRSHGSYNSNSSYGATNSALDDAYKIIGVTKNDSDADIKKAYRRLMSQNHPDKLISKGLPEEMIEIATNKTQEIQKAYDLHR